MGPKTTELIGVLDRTIALLEDDGEDNWSHGLRRARARLQDSDFGGVSMLRAAFGGMGSFSDLVIGQRMVDGEFRWADGYREKNRELDGLRGRIWRLAEDIYRNHEITGAEPTGAGDA